MQVFDLKWWKTDAVLSGVSLGIKIHPSDPNGRKLLAFDCMSIINDLKSKNTKQLKYLILILVCSRVQIFPILILKWILLIQMNVMGLTDVCKNDACESEDPECYRTDNIILWIGKNLP